MKNFFKVFFIIMGVIFSLILLFVAYFFIFDPLNIKPLIFGSEKTFEISQDVTTDSNTNANTSTSTSVNTDTTSQAILLSDSQKKTLETFGIDPTTLPTTITPTQAICFKTQLGETRFAEIVAGDSPSISEFLSAKSCF